MADGLRDDADPHARYASAGIRLAFGRTWDGRIAHISDVPGGAACGCDCPACGTKLVARKGERSRHHFSHAPTSGGAGETPPCDGGHMTALHRFARDLVAERLDLTLPPVAAGEGEERVERIPSRRMAFETGATERGVAGFVADAILGARGKALCVEILVTHACDPAKVEAMRAIGQSMLEIDLSGLPRDTDRPELERLILHESPRRWLSNRLVEALEGEIEARRRAEAAAREEVLRKAAESLRREYATAEAEAMADDPLADTRVRKAIAGGWADLVSGSPSLAPGLFAVHPDRWRAALLTEHLSEGDGATAKQLAWWLGRKGMINEAMVERLSTRSGAFRLSGIPARAVEACIEDWLSLLASKGAARSRGDLWFRDRSVGTRMLTHNQREQARAADLRERRARIDRLDALLREIGEEMPPGSAAGFHAGLETWREGALWGRRPVDMASDGGRHWEEMEGRLAAIVSCLRQETSDVLQSLDLPSVAEAMQDSRRLRMARLRENEEREARFRASEVERLRAEDARLADERAGRLADAATARLWNDARDWLATPLPDSGELPEDAARSAESGLARALAALEVASKERRERDRVVDELRRFAAQHVLDPQRRELLLTASDTRLPGRASMLVHCRDEASLQRCKDLIKPPAKRR